MFETFLKNLAMATKAVMAGGLIALPELPVVLNALVASLGIGELPLPEDLQRAIVQLIIALVGGLVVYQMPNASSEEAEDATDETTKKTTK